MASTPGKSRLSKPGADPSRRKTLAGAADEGIGTRGEGDDAHAEAMASNAKTRIRDMGRVERMLCAISASERQRDHDFEYFRVVRTPEPKHAGRSRILPRREWRLTARVATFPMPPRRLASVLRQSCLLRIRLMKRLQ